MSGFKTLRFRWLRATGKFPSCARVEARRQAQERLFSRYRAFEESADGQRMLELEEYMRSGDFDHAKAVSEQEVFQGSKEQGMLADYEDLQRSSEVRNAIAGKGDTNHPDYKKYLVLKEQVETPEFKERVAYLRDKSRFKKSDAFRYQQELNSIRKSRECRWYLKQKERGTFSEREKEEVVFFDDFDDSSFDRSRWLPRFFWGHALIQKPHSFISDQHGYTDGSNLRVENSRLIIETRAEDFEGIAWDSKQGFMPKRYAYTSGVLTTGESFRQQYGTFEAKVRFNGPQGVYHAFYLVGEQRTPEIDVFRSHPDDARCLSGRYVSSEKAGGAHGTMGPLPFTNEYFILQVEWTPEKIVWRINEMPFFEQRNALPKEPLYMVFLSGIEGNEPIDGVGTLEIDWVRCVARNA